MEEEEEEKEEKKKYCVNFVEKINVFVRDVAICFVSAHELGLLVA